MSATNANASTSEKQTVSKHVKPRFPIASSKPPPLKSVDSANPVPLRVCGYLYPWDEHLNYTARTQRLLDRLEQNEKYQKCSEKGKAYFRKQCGHDDIRKRLAFPLYHPVDVNSNAEQGCYIIGSNGNQKWMDRALDEKRIAAFQKVLGVSGLPRWYRLTVI